MFRGKLLAKLEHAIARAKIPAAREHEARERLKRAAAKHWVVYCLVINLKTAKALGLAIPASLRARADQILE